MKRLKTFIILAIIFIFTASANAAVPTTMTYQGKLTDSAGAPLNSSVDITFKVYDESNSMLWTETLSSVIVTNGIFTVTLGETSAINSSVFTGTDHFLGLAVNADSEMTPRQKLTSVAFSVQAKTAFLGLDLTCSSCVSINELDFDPATQSELDSAISGIVNSDTLAALGCGNGEIAKWNNGSAIWECSAVSAGDITGVTAGTGLTGGNTTGEVTIAANMSVLQSRVSGECPAGQSIRAIDAAGTVTCEVDNDTVVTAPFSLDGANIGGSIITGTNTSAGDYAIGLKGVGSSSSGINYGVWGQSFSSEGTGVFGRAPLYGLYGVAYDISGTTYGVYGSSASADGTGVYGTNTGGGLAAKFDGNVEVVGIITGDGSGLTNLPGGSSGTVTNVVTGTGLTGGPITTTGTISIDEGGVGSTEIADGTIVNVDLADDAVTLAKIDQNGCATDQIMKWDGAAWACAADDDTDVIAPLSLTAANAGAAIITVMNTDTTDFSSGIVAASTATTGSTIGVWALSESINGKGLSGVASAASGTTYGVYGESISPDGMGIYGINAYGGLAGKFAGDVDITGNLNVATITGDGSGLTNLPGGTVTSVATGTGLTGGPITTDGTINVDVGTTANKIVQLDGNAKLPAVDGSQLTGISAADVTVPLSLSGTNPSAGIISAINTDTATFSKGVYGLSSAAAGGVGVYGIASALTGTTYGVWGQSNSISGYGIYGTNTGGGLAAKFDGDVDIIGNLSITEPLTLSGANAAAGIITGTNSSDNGKGVYGIATATSGTTYGVYGKSISPNGYGIYGENTGGGLAAKFDGDVDIIGNLSITAPLSLTGATAGTGTITGTNSSDNGIGVSGKATSTAGSGTTYGVYGSIASTFFGAGVHGQSLATTGSTYGVYGTSASTSGAGVYGANTNSGLAGKFAGDVDITGNLDVGTITGDGSGLTDISASVVSGILTLSGANGAGIINATNTSTLTGSAVIEGVSTATTGIVRGVIGSTASISGTGVYGEATAASGDTRGVTGLSTSTIGTGVYASASAASGATKGVYGASNSPAGYGIYGVNTNGGYAGYFNGKTHVVGEFTATTKSFIQPHAKDPAKEIVYISAEAPEAMVMYRGTATLVNGEAIVIFPDYFALVAASEGLQVQVTPHSIDTYGLAVVERNNENIVVKEFRDGKGTFKFDYFVTAVRSGFENHKPVIDNRSYKPQPNETKAEFEARFAGDDLSSTAIRNMLISNGILEDDGTINIITIENLGWSFAN